MNLRYLDSVAPVPLPHDDIRYLGEHWHGLGGTVRDWTHSGGRRSLMVSEDSGDLRENRHEDSCLCRNGSGAVRGGVHLEVRREWGVD